MYQVTSLYIFNSEIMLKKILTVIISIICFILIDRSIGLILNTGLNRYFGLNQHSEVLLVGHSHLMLAVDKDAFENGIDKKVSKYCREGVNVADRFHMVKQYLDSPYSDSLKIVIYGVDQFMFNPTGLSQNSYKLFYPFIDKYDIDEYIKSSTNKYDYWIHKLICSTRYSDALINSAIRGWLNNWENYKFGTLDIATLQKRINSGNERHILFDPELKQYFENTLDILKRHNIIIILVNTPIAKILNEYEPDKYEEMINYFKSLDKSSSLIYYWDLNPEFSEDDELFYDAIHLNNTGQKVISNYIINNFNNEFNIL